MITYPCHKKLIYVSWLVITRATENLGKTAFILRWAARWGLAHLVWLFALSERLWWTGCRSGEIKLGRPSPDPMTYEQADDLSVLFIAQLYACFGHESIYLFITHCCAKTRKIANKLEQATTTYHVNCDPGSQIIDYHNPLRLKTQLRFTHLKNHFK